MSLQNDSEKARVEENVTSEDTVQSDLVKPYLSELFPGESLSCAYLPLLPGPEEKLTLNVPTPLRFGIMFWQEIYFS